MSYDDDWPDNTMENRRLLVRKTIRPVTIAELKQLAEKRFPVATDPWCARFNAFLVDNTSAKFYQAEVPGGAEVIYCRDAEQAVWFLPGKGMGVVQPNGLAMLKEIVDAL
jgi:hypothetical protein